MAGFKMGLVGEFHTILYDEAPLTTNEYLKGTNRKTLLRLAAFMIDLDPNKSKFYEWRELVNMWFREENNEFKNKIWQRCINLEIKEKARLSLLSPIASLRFFEVAFSFLENDALVDEVTSEINLFKAYLQFVTVESNKDAISDNYLQELDGEYRIAATLLNQTYPVSDFTNYELGDIFITQIIKAYYLFEFLESDEKSKYLLRAFYKSMGVSDWKDYFQFIVPIIEVYSKRVNEGWMEITVEKNDKFEKSCFFLEALSLKNFDTELDADFKLLRGSPLYKVDEGKYAIISSLFVFEKIYKGLYFKLKEVHDSLSIQEKVDKNFRRYYTSKFSENHLLYNIMNHIYGNKNYVQHSGDDLSNKGYLGAPDYYVRNGNIVFLFENKDVFVNAEIKQSFDFRIVEAEFKKKFYLDNKDGKLDAKAVLQLITNVEKVLTLQNEYDKNYNSKNVRIYPLLILHDASFNTPGLNYVINHWFKFELNKLHEKGINISKVKPITIINIDTLILYADFLNSRKKTLNDLIDSYVQFGKFNEKKKYKSWEDFKEAYGATLLSFSYFVDKFTNVGFKDAPILLREKILRKIFPEAITAA
jgi:hypothetical protein